MEVSSTVEFDWIFGKESPYRRVVVSGAIIVQASFGVRFAGGVLERIYQWKYGDRREVPSIACEREATKYQKTSRLSPSSPEFCPRVPRVHTVNLGGGGSSLRVRIFCSILTLSGFATFIYALGSPTVVAGDQIDTNDGGRLLWKAGASPCALTKPVVSADMLFVGSCDGKFYALEKKSGSVVWSHDTNAERSLPSGSFLISPLLRKDLVLTGTVSGCAAPEASYVYAFDKRTGKERWKLKASAASATFADIDEADPNGAVVFGTREGEWLSVQAVSGKVNWRFRATPPHTNCEKKISVATDGVNVCLLAQDGSLHCLEAKSGRELWAQDPASAVTTQLLMYKDVLYFGTADERILGINPESGRRLVELKLSHKAVGGITESDSEARGDFEFAFGIDKTGRQRTLLAFSDNFASILWSRVSVEPLTSEEPEPWKGRAFVGNCKGDIVAYNALSGSLQWNGHVDGCVRAFSHDNSTLYITTREGALYSLVLSSSHSHAALAD